MPLLILAAVAVEASVLTAFDLFYWSDRPYRTPGSALGSIALFLVPVAVFAVLAYWAEGRRERIGAGTVMTWIAAAIGMPMAALLTWMSEVDTCETVPPVIAWYREPVLVTIVALACGYLAGRGAAAVSRRPLPRYGIRLVTTVTVTVAVLAPLLATTGTCSGTGN
jgi:hypothetical protein